VQPGHGVDEGVHIRIAELVDEGRTAAQVAAALISDASGRCIP
jgi:hypothetical protein